MLDAITSEAVLRMFIDGLTVDEVLVALPTLQRSEVERIKYADLAEKRQRDRIKERLDREVGNAAWRIK